MTTYAPAIAQHGSSDGAAWFDETPTIIDQRFYGAAQFAPVTVGRDEVVGSGSLTVSAVAASTFTLVFYAVPHRPALAPWSTSNLPDRYAPRLIEAGRVTHAAPGGVLTVTLDPAVLVALQRSPTWNGVVALVFTASTSVSVTVTALSFATVAAGFAPSLASPGSDSRPDLCPRCGQPIWREDLVKDGYTGTLVCDSCYDPEEPRRLPPTAPRPPINN